MGRCDAEEIRSTASSFEMSELSCGIVHMLKKLARPIC